MGFNVICISHTDGSGGEGVGHAVAERLGCRYVNEEIILEAARLARVDPAVVAATEHKQSLLRRILDSLSDAQQALGPAALATAFAVPVSMEVGSTRADKDDLRGLIRVAIHEVSKSGKAVIAAHAASVALAGKPGVLRVLVTAPNPKRRERIARDRGLSASEADEAIAKGDRARRDYLQTFYAIDEEAPTHYDLVVNTEVLTPDDAAELIVAAASR